MWIDHFPSCIELKKPHLPSWHSDILLSRGSPPMGRFGHHSSWTRAQSGTRHIIGWRSGHFQTVRFYCGVMSLQHCNTLRSTLGRLVWQCVFSLSFPLCSQFNVLSCAVVWNTSNSELMFLSLSLISCFSVPPAFLQGCCPTISYLFCPSLCLFFPGSL